MELGSVLFAAVTLPGDEDFRDVERVDEAVVVGVGIGMERVPVRQDKPFIRIAG